MAVCVASLLTLVSGRPAFAASGRVLAQPNLNIRAEPTGASALIGSIPYNTTVEIICWVKGTPVTGPYGRLDTWDRVSYGGVTGYVADAWMYTGSNNPVGPHCSTVDVATTTTAAPTTSTTAPGSPATTAPSTTIPTTTTTAAPSQGARTRVSMGMPFAGRYGNRSFGTYPGQHPVYLGADFAADLYAYSGTAVKAIFSPAAGNMTLRVDRISSNCAGSGVRVAIFVDGAQVGWVYYGHLKNVRVSQGQTISSGTVLGTTYRWANCSAWQVRTPEGVHTHVEVYNSKDRACWIGHGSNASLGEGAEIARLGGSRRSLAAC